MPYQKHSLTIGWYMSESKANKLKFADFIEYAKNLGCNFKNILSDESLNESKFDVIIAKLFDANSDKRVEQVIAVNPHAVIIDPIRAQRQIMDREFMHKLLCNLCSSTRELDTKCVKGYLIRGQEDVASLPADFKFPCVIKNLQASGGFSLHLMAVVWKPQDLNCISFPVHAEEYTNHNGTVFKVYVLGKSVHVVSRISLPNFSEKYRKPIVFNSQLWKHELPPELTFEYSKTQPPPDMQSLQIIAKKLSCISGLTLFGYDLIVDAETGSLNVIDVNFFPDYFKIPNMFETLYQFIMTRYEEENNRL